jgi:hypothetical protein
MAAAGAFPGAGAPPGEARSATFGPTLSRRTLIMPRAAWSSPDAHSAAKGFVAGASSFSASNPLAARPGAGAGRGAPGPASGAAPAPGARGRSAAHRVDGAATFSTANPLSASSSRAAASGVAAAAGGSAAAAAAAAAGSSTAAAAAAARSPARAPSPGFHSDDDGVPFGESSLSFSRSRSFARSAFDAREEDNAFLAANPLRGGSAAAGGARAPPTRSLVGAGVPRAVPQGYSSSTSSVAKAGSLGQSSRAGSGSGVLSSSARAAGAAGAAAPEVTFAAANPLLRAASAPQPGGVVSSGAPAAQPAAAPLTVHGEAFALANPLRAASPRA